MLAVIFSVTPNINFFTGLLGFLAALSFSTATDGETFGIIKTLSCIFNHPFPCLYYTPKRPISQAYKREKSSVYQAFTGCFNLGFQMCVLSWLSRTNW